MSACRQAVILAGGLGTRLRPLTEAIPKVLLPVGEKSLLELQIMRLKKFGFTEVFLATNYKSDYIQAFFGNGDRLGIKVTVSKEDKPLGTCGPLTLVKDRLEGPFVVMNGDILTTIDFGALMEHAEGTEAELMVVTKEIVQPFAFGNVFSEGGFITGVEEKPDFKKEIIAGIYVMKPPIFDYIPHDEYFGMDSLIKNMLTAGQPVAKHLMHELWLDIGQPPDYDKAQKLYKTHFQD